MDKHKRALAIAKAIAYAENGGKPKLNALKAGKTGELKSIFQFMPKTWENYSKQTFGKVVPLTHEAESEVVLNKVNKWLDQGYNESQIASMWNAGEGRPDAYKQNWKGVNSKGVSYDTPAYAKKVASYTRQFETQLNTNPNLKDVTSGLADLPENPVQKSTGGGLRQLANSSMGMPTGPAPKTIGSLVQLANGGGQM